LTVKPLIKEVDIMDRPELNNQLDSKTFREYYYLKEELIDFCRRNNLQTTGGKIELTDRIAMFLDTGERISKTHDSRRTKIIDEITLDSIIEDNFVCSEKHRAFYKKEIGKSFSFNVLFQKWLKSNAGKTYKDSIDAYYKILEDKKNNKTTIDKQFEYNTYIRDFFNDNKDKTLDDAIKCWKYKKSLKGHNKYEKEDLKIL
jgi:dTDP-glucose pyrophosphorylase